MLSIVGNINCLIYISHGVCWTICELFISNILGFFSLVKNILGLFWCWRGSNMPVVAVYYCITSVIFIYGCGLVGHPWLLPLGCECHLVNLSRVGILILLQQERCDSCHFGLAEHCQRQLIYTIFPILVLSII